MKIPNNLIASISIKALIVLCYFIMGIYIMVTNNILGQHSPVLKYTAGVLMILYGAYRVSRIYQEYKSKRDE